MTTTNALPAQRTAADSTISEPAPVWQPLTELELALRQLAAVERWNDARRAVESAAAVSPSNRHARMELARRLECVYRQHAAIVARTAEHLQSTGGTLGCRAACRVVLAHRSPWFLDRVSAVLRDRGLTVVARLDNGADALGEVVAEQPDLVLVEDALAMVPGEQLVPEVLRVCPHARVVAQVAYADRVGALLDAGAIAVFTRRVPPVDVALAMHRLVRPRPSAAASAP